MKLALTYNGKVVQIEESAFPVHPSMKWVIIPEDATVEVGGAFDGVEFGKEPEEDEE